MHGIRREDFYKTPAEEKAFAEKLKKGFKLLDTFVATVQQSELTVDSAGGLLEDPVEADRMFSLSGEITDFMPEFYPSWNYRKNYMLQKTVEPERLLSLLRDELTFIESVLKKAPKCYAVWHHRLWVLTVLFNVRPGDLMSILTKEVSLCMLFFQFDGRNFHGWGHLNYVRHYLKQLEATPEPGCPGETDKLCSTEFMKLIKKNFSNYSAWFNHGSLSETCGSVTEDLENLTPAIYTDPNDQCLWHYFDFLLYHRNALRCFLVRAHYFQENRSFAFYFNECVCLSSVDSFVTAVTSAGHFDRVEGQWEPVSHGVFSRKLTDLSSVPNAVWRFVPKQPINMVERVSVNLMIETDDDLITSYYSHMTQLPKCIRRLETPTPKSTKPCLLSLSYKLSIKSDGEMPIDLDSVTIMRSNMSSEKGWDEMNAVLGLPIRLPGSSRLVSLGKDITAEIFMNQLEMMSTLIGMGTESKYLYLAEHKIRRFLGKTTDAEECYNRAKTIDPLRAIMYDDLLLTERVQETLERIAATGESHASLNGMGIKNLSYSSLYPHLMFKELDLGSNCLSDSSLLDFGVGVMLQLERLYLANNRLKSLDRVLGTLRNLRNLRWLDISGNPLSPIAGSAFDALPPCLVRIDITGTPLAASLLEEDDASTESTHQAALDTHIGAFFVRLEECSGYATAGSKLATGGARTSRVFLERPDA